MSDAPVVLVTGASRGIGAALAGWLGRVGARVVLAARTRASLEPVEGEVRRLGGEALSVPTDVAYPEACYDLVERALAEFGHLDAVVNNAGIVEPIAPLERTNPVDWGRNLQVNLLGPYYVTRYALPSLRARSGRLVNVGSGAALKVIPGWSAYCTAKAGLLHMTRMVAAEAPEVTVISFRPGVVDTQMQEVIRRLGPEGMPAEAAEAFRAMKSEGRLLPPEVPARAAAWLALHAPQAWSGEFVQHDDPRVAGPALALFGESLA